LNGTQIDRILMGDMEILLEVAVALAVGVLICAAIIVLLLLFLSDGDMRLDEVKARREGTLKKLLWGLLVVGLLASVITALVHYFA
jgi:hypothetical protein